MADGAHSFLIEDVKTSKPSYFQNPKTQYGNATPSAVSARFIHTCIPWGIILSYYISLVQYLKSLRVSVCSMRNCVIVFSGCTTVLKRNKTIGTILSVFLLERGTCMLLNGQTPGRINFVFQNLDRMHSDHMSFTEIALQSRLTSIQM